MRIYFHELSDEPTELTYSERDAWVREAIESANETSLEATKGPNNPSYTVEMSLKKNQVLVFLDGYIKAEVTLLCSRCASPVSHPLNGEFKNLFTRDKELESNSHQFILPKKELKANVRNDLTFSSQIEDDVELDIEIVEHEYLDLGDILKQHVFLMIPFQPLCKEDCKGVCATCGQDQNTNPCQCHRLKSTPLARALEKYKNSLLGKTKGK